MRHVTVAAVIMLVLVFVAFLYVQSPSYPPSPGPFVAGGHPASAAAPAQQASFATGTGTNLTASAEDFSGGKWHPENLAVAAATAKAPDGSTGAYNLTETTVDGRHRSETIVAGLTPGSSYTLSIFIRPAGRHLVEFEMRDKTPGKYSVVRFDLNRKVVDGVKGDSDASGVQELPDGWLRIWAAMPYTGDEAVFDIALMDDKGEVMYAGVANEGVSVWGVQFEPGNGPREYSTTLATPR